MTILLARYSGFAPEIFENGAMTRLKDCSVRLYLLLCRESDRSSTRRFAMTDKYAFKQASISATSMRTARKELQAYGLIAFERETVGGAYTYTHCDPKTGKPFPGDPKRRPASQARGNEKPKNESVAPAPEVTKPKAQEPLQFLPTGERDYFPNGFDTSFEFGAGTRRRG